MDEGIETWFSPKPEEPQESDCCGSGCNPCVFDIYRKQLSEWEKRCEEIASNNGSQIQNNESHGEPVLSEIKYTPFQLISVKQHTCNSFLYTFQAVEGNLDSEQSQGLQYVPIKRPLGIQIGQHLILKGYTGEDKANVITRAYTVISGPILSNIGCFEVLVKLYDKGKMSSFFKGLHVNDIVQWRGPYGDFRYKPNSHRFILMLCAGTGIAPMYPIAKSIVLDELDETFIRMLFACKDFDDILLRKEIQNLKLYWNFTAKIFLSQGLPEDLESKVFYNEDIKIGRIDKNVIFKELYEKKLHQVFALVCGTKSFNKDMLNFLKQAGVPEENIHLF